MASALDAWSVALGHTVLLLGGFARLVLAVRVSSHCSGSRRHWMPRENQQVMRLAAPLMDQTGR